MRHEREGGCGAGRGLRRRAAAREQAEGERGGGQTPFSLQKGPPHRWLVGGLQKLLLRVEEF